MRDRLHVHEPAAHLPEHPVEDDRDRFHASTMHPNPLRRLAGFPENRQPEHRP